MAGEENGVLQYLFFCTRARRDAYEKYPEVLLIDSTYKTNKCNMPLTVFVCLDSNGHGRVAGYCFVIRVKKPGMC